MVGLKWQRIVNCQIFCSDDVMPTVVALTMTADPTKHQLQY